MPPAVKQSSLLAKYRAKGDAAAKAHAKDSTTYGGGRPPAGIRGGIAQLTGIGFKQYAQGSKMTQANGSSAVGETYWYAEAIIIEPESVVDPLTNSVVRVKGLQTRIQEPLCPTKLGTRDVDHDEHVSIIMNHLRRLGGEDYTKDVTQLGDLDGLCEALKEAGPYFRFDTVLSKEVVDPKTKQAKQRYVNEYWNGTKGLEGYSPESNGQPVVDNTGPAEEPTAETPEEPAAEEEDLDALAKAAVGKGDAASDAQAKLKELAMAAGHTEDEVDNTDSWEGVVELCRNPKEEGGDEPAEKADPAKGDVYVIQLLDAKTKKKKDTTVEVASVNSKGRWVTVLNLDTDRKVVNDPKTKKPLQVSWDDLEAS